MTNTFDRLKTALADRYAINEELGAGGMATVYLAEDLKHHRKVAVKVLRADLAATLGPERFLREIEIAAQLQHPHVLPLYDSGEADGFLYYVMPYVEGESLRSKIARERELPIDDAVRILRDVVDALAYAHEHNVVHRDIKPDNVMISGRHALVMDFGVAKAVSEATGREQLTTAGVALGTPSYMAPEQAAADPQIDHRADVYAVGAMAYELFTGRPPFVGTTPQAVLSAHVTKTPDPVTDHRTSVPEPLSALVMKCLEKKPADRWQDANVILRQLDSIITPSGGTTPVRGVPSGRRWWPIAAGAALVVAAILGVASVGRGGSDVLASATKIAVVPFTPSVADTALSRLGRELVLTVSYNLEGVGDIRTVDASAILLQVGPTDVALPLQRGVELAVQFGAGSVLHGNLLRVGDQVQLQAALVEAASREQLARVSVTAPIDDIVTLTDSLTWGLLRQVWQRGEAPSPLIRAGMTTSLTAMRAFLEGERAMVESRYPVAVDAYRRAMAADSTFWLAYWRYKDASRWLFNPVEPEISAALDSHAAELPPRERMLVEVAQAPTRRERHRRGPEVTEQFPDYWPGWFEWADDLVHSGGALGHRLEEAIEALERTVQLNPAFTAGWEHVADFYNLMGDTVGSLRAIEALERLEARESFIEGWGYDQLLVIRAIRALVSSGGAGAQPLLDSVTDEMITRHLPDDITSYLSHWIGASGFPIHQLEISEEVVRRTAVREVADAHRRAAVYTWASRGEWQRALEVHDVYAGQRSGVNASLEAYRLATIGAWLGALPAAAAEERRGQALRDTAGSVDNQAELAWLDGMRAVLARDEDQLARARTAVAATNAEYAQVLAASLAGFALELQGQQEEAARALAAVEWGVADTLGWRSDHPFVPSVNRLAASRWLVAAGDSTEGFRLLDWYSAGPSPNSLETMTAIPFAQLEQARILADRGDVELARFYVTSFLRRYDMPPPAHTGLVQEAERLLARLGGVEETMQR